MNKYLQAHDNISIQNNIDKKINDIIGECDDPQIFLPTYVPKKLSKKILVLSGGGIKGIALIGALHALYELNILQNIQTFAGTSVGSIIAFLIIIGFVPSKIFDFVKIFDLNKLKCLSVSMLLESYGLDSGEKIVKTLEGFMVKMNIKNNITFSELFELTKKTFYVTSVNISMRKVEYFSHVSHPNLEVTKAIRMSISVPFLFTPVLYNNCMYVDGGCIDNFPMSCFDGQMDDVLGICTIEGICSNNKITNMYDYIFNVICSLINGISETSIKKYEKNVVKIVFDDMVPFDFNLSHEQKKQMFNLGYCAIHSFMNK